MRQPNFLILDEPTNDLDITTITVLEEFLLQYTGCLLIVSHDRFFMDKIVDHLFVFEGNGIIKDIRGDDEYRTPLQAWLHIKKDEKKGREKEHKKLTIEHKTTIETFHDGPHNIKKKLSYLEKKELQQLEQDLDTLEVKKQKYMNELDQPDLPYEEINMLSLELKHIGEQIHQTEMRRLGLSERV